MSAIRSIIGDALSDVNGNPFLTNPSLCSIEAPGAPLPLRIL